MAGIVIQPESEPTLHSASAGQRVFGRHVLARIVGRGGRGVVWQARDEVLRETVALKFLPDALRWDSAALDELKTETRRARQLTHPNIVRIHDFVSDENAAAISMEFVDGRSLAELRLLKPDQVFAPAEIASWLPQLCEALDYAHAQAHIVHRDLKPSNLLLTETGVLKIADFGVARSLVDATTRISGWSGGTLSYMSPQQAMGAGASSSDDIYALGATLYELLTGKPPFHSGDVHAQIMHRSPESMNLRRSAIGVAGIIPERWETAIEACLAKRPEDRPASAADLLERLMPPKASSPPERGFGIRVWPVAAALAAIAVGGAVWLFKNAESDTPAATRSLADDTASGATERAQAAGAVAAMPTPFAEFADDFSSALTGWLLWGEPRPQRIRSFQGRLGVFDNHGDGMHHSGITSLARFSMPEGFVVESDVFLNVMNPAGCHCEAYVSLTRDPDRWMNPFGSGGDGGEGLEISLNFAGDACWGTPADRRRHTWLGAGFLAEDGQRLWISDELPDAALEADSLANRWVSLRVEVNAQREVRFYADGKLCWAPKRRVHPSLLLGQRLILKGRSLGTAGKAYHDGVRLRAVGAEGTSESHSTPNLPAGRELTWNEMAWEAGADQPAAIEALRSATRSGTFTLTNADGPAETSLLSRLPLDEPLMVYFDVQPFLQSHAGVRDLARLGLSARRPDGTRRFVGIELAGGVAWVVDTARAGRLQRIRQVGTYTPGSWQSYALQVLPPSQLDIAGSLMEYSAYDLSERPADGWRIEVTVRDSADGVALRPVRAAGWR